MAISRKPSTRILTGDKELDAKLQRIKLSIANKYVRRGMTKALRLTVKSIKAQVPSQYKDAKRAIGMRFDSKGAGGATRAKAGAGVGKPTRANTEKTNRRAAEGKSGKRGGVGISASNIHWMILGTGERSRTSGGSTGRMPPILADIVKAGATSSTSAAIAAIREEVEKGIAIEAAKK